MFSYQPIERFHRLNDDSFVSALWSLVELVILVCLPLVIFVQKRVSLTVSSGSHIVFKLLETRRYKVISIDNYHNSYPTALLRVSHLARESLPIDATEQDLDSTEVDSFSCDLKNSGEVRAIFEKYGKGGIWGVIHVAVRTFIYLARLSLITSSPYSLLGL